MENVTDQHNIIGDLPLNIPQCANKVICQRFCIVASHKWSTSVSGCILVACLWKPVQERHRTENVNHEAT
jgi:hypothetical protein